MSANNNQLSLSLSYSPLHPFLWFFHHRYAAHTQKFHLYKEITHRNSTTLACIMFCTYIGPDEGESLSLSLFSFVFILWKSIFERWLRDIHVQPKCELLFRLCVYFCCCCCCCNATSESVGRAHHLRVGTVVAKKTRKNEQKLDAAVRQTYDDVAVVVLGTGPRQFGFRGQPRWTNAWAIHPKKNFFFFRA